MRIAACVIAIFGAVVGILSSNIHFGSPTWTVVLSIAGALCGVLVLLKFRYAPWLLLAIAIAGIFPDAILWEGAGSFFLVSSLIGFSLRRNQKEA